GRQGSSATPAEGPPVVHRSCARVPPTSYVTRYRSIAVSSTATPSPGAVGSSNRPATADGFGPGKLGPELRVRPLPAQQRADLTRLRARVRLAQHTQRVLGRVGTARRPASRTRRLYMWPFVTGKVPTA